MNAHPKLPMLKAFTEFMRRKPKSLETAYARAFEAGWQACDSRRSEQVEKAAESAVPQGVDCRSERS
jgi:hypothetical protein